MVKKKLTKQQLQELQGFEDIMDVVIEEKEIQVQEKKRKELEKFNDSFELYNFLEYETLRLKKLDNFFSYKISNIKANPQTIELNKRQEERKNQVKGELANKIIDINSPFHQNLKLIFNSSFTKKKE